MSKPLTTADYPLAETRPELVRGARGKTLADITLDGVIDCTVAMDDLRITPGALLQQAEIARAAGRATRAAELAIVPQDAVMEVYELLRPGRAGGRAELLAAARRLRDDYGANRIAAFVEEAADVYERRGLFTFRY